MNIQSEKLDLIQWIIGLNATTILDRLKAIKRNYSKSSDW